MKVASEQETAKVILLVFSQGTSEYGCVSSDRIFRELISKQLWYVTRLTRGFEANSTVIFYQAKAGIRGYATVEQIFQASAIDKTTLRHLGLNHLTLGVRLRDISVFDQPLHLGTIVEQLDFVANKKYWGHSLRATPRLISDKDFQQILRASRVRLPKSS